MYREYGIFYYDKGDVRTFIATNGQEFFETLAITADGQVTRAKGVYLADVYDQALSFPLSRDVVREIEAARFTPTHIKPPICKVRVLGDKKLGISDHYLCVDWYQEALGSTQVAYGIYCPAKREYKMYGNVTGVAYNSPSMYETLVELANNTTQEIDVCSQVCGDIREIWNFGHKKGCPHDKSL